MADGTVELAGCLLQMSGRELHNAHHAGSKRAAAKELSCFKALREENTMLKDRVPVVTISVQYFVLASRAEKLS